MKKKEEEAPSGYEWKTLPKIRVEEGKTTQIKGKVKILIPVSN